MFRRNNKICRPKQGIWTGSKYLNWKLEIGNWKLYFCSFTLPYPISLLYFYFRKIINSVKSREKPFGILCDCEKPLFFFAFFCFSTAPLAFASDNLLICKPYLA